MGKFRTKLKGQTKGKRWPKGQSSSSNPTTQKYRSLAKSNFFQENLETKPGLTLNALRKHDVMQGFAVSATRLDNLTEGLHDVNLEDNSNNVNETVSQSCGTFRTFQTFASDWSECTNISFSKLLCGFKSNSALHKEMLAILAAITELLKEKGGSQTSTEYYMALIEVLSTNQEESGIHAALSLLSMGIKSVSTSVLKMRFAESSKIFMDLLEKHCNSENHNILRCLLGCISIQLRALDQVQWGDSSTLQMFDIILAFCIHSKPKIRKAAQHAVSAITRGSSFMLQDNAPKLHPASAKVSRFCLQQLKPELQTSSQTTILHILTLLKDVLHTFPRDDIKIICERILSIMTANNILVRTCCLQTVHALFLVSSKNKQQDMLDFKTSEIQATNLTSPLAAKLIKALYDYRPDKTDVRQTIAWITVMQQGHICLTSLDLDLCLNMLPLLVSTCTTDLWLSEHLDIANASTIALREVLYECVAPACSTLLGTQQYKDVLKKIFQIISKALTVPFGHAAENVVNVLAVCFEVAGRTCADLLSEPLRLLGERRDPSARTLDKSSVAQIDHAIAIAVKTMGPEFLLQCIPLTLDSGDISIDRSWLLPILKDKIHGSTLAFFGSRILHLASICRSLSEQCSQQDGRKNDAITYDLLCSQLWNLFPGFCNSPTDITDSFKKIAKVLGDVLNQRPELRSSVLQGLRKLISSAEDPDEVSELARFAKNFLPLLLNIYTTPAHGGYEQGQRFSALETIQIYLTITSADKCEEIFKNLQMKLEDVSKQPNVFLHEALLDVSRAMVVYQSEETIQDLFVRFLLPLCEVSDKPQREKAHKSLQKKAFRIIEDILRSNKEGCKGFTKNNRKQLQTVITKSLNNSAENSRATRLRSLELLIKSQPQLDCDSKLVKSCIAEAVLSTKDINSKCRDCAQRLLIAVGEVMESKKNGLVDYINLITVGLAGTPQMAAVTLQALASITYHFSGSLGMETLQFLLKQVCSLLASSSREITVAAINFILVFIKSLPKPQVALLLQDIMTGLASMSEDCKRHARLELGKLLKRMSRKYTAETLTKLAPIEDIVIHKRLRNLRKQESRTKRLGNSKEETIIENDDFTDVTPRIKSIEEILADSDSDIMCDDDDNMKNKVQKNKKLSKRRGKSLIHETEDSIIDLVDVSAASKILSSRPENVSVNRRPQSAANRGFKTSSDGRLIIDDLDSSDNEDSKKKSISQNDNDSCSDSDYEDIDDSGKPTLGKRKRSDIQSQKSAVSCSSGPSAKYHAGGRGIHRSLSGASVRSGVSEKSYNSIATSTKSAGFGSEYRSKRATGDVKIKGRPDPYAYVPLLRSSLNKRKRAKNAGQFRVIIKSAKKGAVIGSKLNKIMKKKM